MASTSDFSNGFVIEMDKNLFSIVEFQHVKPGKGPAFVRTKLKNVSSGKVIDKTFRAGEKVDHVRLETHEYQYLYKDGDFYTFMHMESFEQIALPEEKLSDAIPFLKENDTVQMLMREEAPITIEVGNFVELEITYCEPGVKGDTAQGGTKPATCETGLILQVPLFVEQNEVIKIDTRTGKYLSRV